MSGIDVAIGVENGMVIAQWREPTQHIEFDAKNAYMIGLALCRAAMEAHRGSKNGEPRDDLAFIGDELSQSKVKISDLQRVALINEVSTMIKTFRTQAKSDGYLAMHAVDRVLAETAR